MMKINGGQSTRVNPEGHGEEASGEEDGVLDGVEACAREGCRVVALVVQLVDVLVQESTLELMNEDESDFFKCKRSSKTGSGPGSQLTLHGWRRRWRR